MWVTPTKRKQQWMSEKAREGALMLQSLSAAMRLDPMSDVAMPETASKASK